MTDESSFDQRIGFAKQYVLKSMKMKSDKWDKMKSIEDNEILLNEFLEKGDALFLVFFVNPGGQLTPTNQFPPGSKNKIIYFIKHKHEAVQPGKLQQICFYGDLSYAPLDHLAGLVDQVLELLPINVPILATLPCDAILNSVYFLDSPPSAWK